jgi:hypothetical protein
MKARSLLTLNCGERTASIQLLRGVFVNRAPVALNNDGHHFLAGVAPTQIQEERIHRQDDG